MSPAGQGGGSGERRRLISGVSTAVKELIPGVRVYGCEPAAVPKYTTSLAAGKPVAVEQKQTVADALTVQAPETSASPMLLGW